jgi:hypothetical protein
MLFEIFVLRKTVFDTIKVISCTDCGSMVNFCSRCDGFVAVTECKLYQYSRATLCINH